MIRNALNAVSRSTLAIAAIAAIGALAACSNSGEQIFTRQNQAATALATMVMDAEAKGAPQSAAKIDRIYAAESDLHEACAPLREMASQRMSGETVGFDAELIALVSLDRCEAETRRVEDFIRTDNPAVARAYLSPTYSPGARK